MSGNFFTITVVGANRRLDLRLPADVPVGELTGDLVTLLDQPADGPPPRWGLVRLGGEALDSERGLAAQAVPAGAMLFLRDLGVVQPPAAVDDYAAAVAAVVEAHPGRWTPAAFQALLVVAGGVAVVAAGLLAARALLAGESSEAPALLATGVALGAVVIGRLLGSPRSGVALALCALPLWAAAGVGLYLQLGLRDLAALAGGLVGVAIGGLAAVAAADEGMGPTVGVVTASLPWALALALGAWLQQGVGADAAVLVPLSITLLRLLPWTTVRLTGLSGEPPAASLAARTATARAVLGALTAGIAVTLAGACAVLVLQPGWWGRALALTAAAAALLHARRRRFTIEVASLCLVALATLAAFEVPEALRGPGRPEVLVGIAAALVPLGLVGRTVRLPVGVRRQLERLEALVAAATGPLALGMLGFYDEVARFAARFI